MSETNLPGGNLHLCGPEKCEVVRGLWEAAAAAGNDGLRVQPLAIIAKAVGDWRHCPLPPVDEVDKKHCHLDAPARGAVLGATAAIDAMRLLVTGQQAIPEGQVPDTLESGALPIEQIQPE